jgi:hypothetical protein
MYDDNHAQAKNPQLLRPEAMPKVLPRIAAIILEVLAEAEALADQTTTASLAAVLKQLMATPHVRRRAETRLRVLGCRAGRCVTVGG